jgi:hypothetical protein
VASIRGGSGQGDGGGTRRGNGLVEDSGPDAIVAMLQRHDLSLQTAQAVLTLGERLRAGTLRAGVEFGAMVDAATGAPVGHILRGEVHTVDPHLHFLDMEPGREYVHLHTHPNSTPISDADAIVFVLQRSLRAITVIARDGSWYALSRQAGTQVETSRAIAARFDAEMYARVSAAIVAGRRAGLSDEEILRRVMHEVWTAITPQLGLQYDRVDPPSR